MVAAAVGFATKGVAASGATAARHLQHLTIGGFNLCLLNLDNFTDYALAVIIVGILS